MASTQSGGPLLIDARNLDFVLFDWLEVENLTGRARFAEHSRETFAQAIDSARRIAVEQFVPHNRKADENEPSFDGTRVHVIPELAPALEAFAQAGFLAATHDATRGGMQLPFSVAQACFALFNAANVSTAAYPFLTMAAANMLAGFGTPEQQRRYLEPMLSGRFFGTMALTEPQAGSSLSDLRCVAVPTPGGGYRLRGRKIFISAGEHELSENIVHLVLARIEGAPPGSRGISLFIVPKFRVNPDATLGERNDVRLMGLIHKMGYRGTTSTMLAFGDEGDCHAELIGAENQGIACMFQMMNEARIGVGLGATMLGYAAYLAALDYARNRPQGRQPGAKDPRVRQVMIVEHADVKRMLLAQKAAVEGSFALCLYCARLVDDARTATAEPDRAASALLLEVLTPIAKAWPSQYCFEATSLAIQVMGGYGYTRDYAVEQYFRDNRLNPIHEGTNGIQAIDLLGRKVSMRGGAAFKALCERIETSIEKAGGDPVLAGHAARLGGALADAKETTPQLIDAIAQDPQRGLANAAAYLDAVGHIVVAWLLLDQARVATRARRAPLDADFARGKRAACDYFFAWELPKCSAWFELLRELDATCLEAHSEWL